jgi:hypothetical protein
MSIYSFKNTPVRFVFNNTTGALPATSVSFSSTNSISPVKSLGKRQAYYHQVPADSVIHNVSISYNIQNDDPIKLLINNMKDNLTDAPPICEVDIGGLRYSGCFLDSFSFSIEPNTIVNAQSSFFTFDPPSGQIGAYIDGQTLDADFLHGSRATVALTPNNFQSQVENYDDIFDMSYSFRANYLPVKVLNYRKPKTVKFNGATEEFEMNESLYRRILYTGESRNITFDLEAICCPGLTYSVTISGAQNVTVEGNSAVDGLTLAKRRFTKFY